ncbi:hypothetical protein GUY61_11610 [Streptomyces sp. GC420]|nr:hypothetical protein [Streptomyces sp. GC420]
MRAVAVALLNLSGLGLGYLLLRRWIPAVLCWIATAVLLVIALPADPDGVPGGLLLAYLLFLLLAAADGARGALRRPAGAPDPGPARLRPPLAVALAVALLAVPAGGAVAYDAARDEAVERMLLDRLAAVDALVEDASATPFPASAGQYRKALARYREIAAGHEGSRAAKLVPDRLRTYYATVAAPYEQGRHCDAVPPLQYLRTLPGTMGRELLADGLAEWPDERLAASLYECGVSRLGLEPANASGGELGELMRTFPGSPQAAKVEPAFRARIRELDGRLSGDHDPCDVTADLERLGETASGLPGESATTLAGATDGPVESGTYACGVEQFRNGEFTEARETLTGFADTYRDSDRRGRARNIAIAAEIAEEEPAAGKRVPSAAVPGGSGLELVIRNDAPDAVEILFTGPVTGKVDLKACDGCETYPTESSGKGSACQDSGRNYPRTRLLLPAGDYHFLYKRSDETVANAKHTSRTTIEPGYTYTDCTYMVDDPFGLDVPLPDLPGPES